MENINTLYERIHALESELKLAFDNNLSFYSKKEILQRLRTARHDLEQVLNENPVNEEKLTQSE